MIFNLARIRRKLEKDLQLNQLLCIVITAVWTVLAFAVSKSENTSLIVLLLTAVYHLFLSWLVLRHIFNYVQKKAPDHTIFQKRLNNYWLLYILGLTASLFLYSYDFVFGGSIASFVGGYIAMMIVKAPLSVEHVGGTRPVSYNWARSNYLMHKDSTDPGIFFGGLILPTTEATTHLMLVGTNGSGKTNLFRLTMQSVLPRLQHDHHGRALVYDPATEFLPVLVGMGVSPEHIYILNPFDDRACVWDLAKDLTRDRDAIALAELLLPEKEGKGGDNDFFDKAARRIITGVVKFFMRTAPGVWTLRDLVLAAQNAELVTALLSQDRQLARNLTVLGAGNTAGNVLSTIAATIGDSLETIAAYCDYHMRGGRTFTLEEWYQGNDILLMGSDRESNATLKPYNQLLFTRASQMLLNGASKKMLPNGNTEENITYLMLDELPSLGRLGNIAEISKEARKCNGSLLVAFQAYTDLEHIYTKELANSLIGQFDKAAYLRIRDFQTAEWASKQIGQQETIWRPRTDTEGSSNGEAGKPTNRSTSVSYGETKETKPVVRPEDIMNLPKPNKKTGQGVQGFYRVDEHFYSYVLTSAQISAQMMPAATAIEAYEPAPPFAEDLRLWSDDDIDRLGIKRILSLFDSEQMKTLPIEDWVELAASEVRELLDEINRNELSDDDDLSREH